MTRTAHRTPLRNHPRKWPHAASSSIGDSHEGDSRLHTVVDDRHHSYYAYDHTGERTLKVTGHSHQLDVNADLMHTAAGLDEFTLYPSPYLVFTNRGYTKHYYAGTERLAARIGGGFDRAILREQTDLAMTATHLFKQSQHHTNERHLNAPPAHTIRREGHLERVFRDMEIEFAIPEAVRAEVHLDPEGLIQAAQNIVSDNTEPEVYFYHSDHLGSASWITDSAGTPIQHLQYLPYGEPFVNQRAAGSTYSERFRFTGKERDEETGYSYFSARYLDHEILTSFLSVDRYADKYPFISPYAYCAWNPIKLIDPSGDTLIALDRQSQLDIISLAGSYRERVRFNDRGAASIDYSGMSEDEINTMNSDLGVGLIKDISDSPVRILYEATDLVLCTDLDGNKTAGHLNTDRTKICNLSRGGFDSNDGYSGMMPREGYDGQVVISPNAKYYCDGFQVFRTEIIGHELAENYARTAFNCNYNPNNNGDTPMERLGAHQYANQRMQNPHKAYSVRYKPQYNPQYLKMANEYLGY